MRNLKYDRNELIYKTEQESQTQKTYVWLPKGKGGKDKSGGWAEHTHTTTHKTDNPQDLIYSTGNSQYSVIT